MSVDVDVPYFQQRISLLICGLKERFDELEARDFPSDVPSDLIQLVRAILRIVESKIATSGEKELPLIFSLLCLYQKQLQFVDNAHTEQAPIGLVSIIRDLLQRVSPDSRFFVAPLADEYNYSIRDLNPAIMQSLDHLLTQKELESLPAAASSPLRLITFPRAERDNVLIHAVFGHEVGHILTNTYLDEEEVTPAYSAAIQQAMTEASQIWPGGSLKDKAELQKALRKLRRRAMEELLSDYVGALIFGPSAIFASHEIFSLFDIDASPATPYLYPPHRYRYRLVFNALKEEGFIDAVARLASKSNGVLNQLASLVTGSKPNYFAKGNELLERLAAIIARDDDEVMLKAHGVVGVAYEWVQKSLPAAKIAIKAAVPANLIYSANDFEREVPELIERLALNIPPNELGTYPNVDLPCWQSALASAWFFRICGERVGPVGNEKLSLDDLLAINRYCLRAVESIALHQEYKQHLATV